MFPSESKLQHNKFLEHTQVARLNRAQEKVRNHAASAIQAVVRGFLKRQELKKAIRCEVDQMFLIPRVPAEDYNPTLIPALTVFNTLKRFFFFMDDDKDKKRFEYICRYLLLSINSQQNKDCYVFVAFSKDHVIEWIKQIKHVLWKCCMYIEKLQPELHVDMKIITVYLHMLITFTNASSWKILKSKSLLPAMNQLCNNIMGHLHTRGLYTVLQRLLHHGIVRSKPVFQHVALSAISTIALRPLLAADFSTSLFSDFLFNILSVPAVIYHISTTSPEMMIQLTIHRIFRRSLDYLMFDQNLRILHSAINATDSLCFLANLTELGEAELEGLVDNSFAFMSIVIKILERCRDYVWVNKSSLSHWHPILGWFSHPTQQSTLEALQFVSIQLKLLWSPKMVRLLFMELVNYIEVNKRVDHHGQSKSQFLRFFEKRPSKSTNPKLKLDGNLSQTTCLPCVMYQTCLSTMVELRLDILAGLSYQGLLLPSLWTFLKDLGSHCGLNKFIELMEHAPDAIHPVFSLLSLFCDCATHLITILDENEFYSDKEPFTLADYILMSDFLNQFIFRVIWFGFLDFKMASTNPFFLSLHMLLMVLYERDSRRAFAPPDHWLNRDVKPKEFMISLEKGKKPSQFLLYYVPHCIPFKERVVLFRSWVEKEKETLGLIETSQVSPHAITIAIHRSRTVEDGYRQLVTLPVNSLKGIIRVKFINDQGLDEAGIDQNGVFKEFLEETIAKVFDPSLNLFKVTNDQKLYPSPSSHIHENHLGLLEFVGKMLGKAMYEGIVVDVPFASFFLTQILGHQYMTYYSFLDDLPSLDAELYKNLTFVKNYDGDVSDLDLTFSCDEDFLGRLMTYELIPGGRTIPVTNENRISYVHQMAKFRLHGQIKEQANAFIRGLKTIINSDWLMMFSTQEVQKLISGASDGIDVCDLRNNTQYYGGYHSRHKVISWLWNILETDFNPKEQALFLKFVTSCSKPPLLGFSHLEPPFSIRCVEISDDQDTGDTVGSVLKGFFNIRKRDQVSRLPTSSTCFNLLKLPNYSKKAVLKEKLRYAIHSNTGFELS